MLRIAVPNKGMLSEPAWNMLAEAGYRLRTNPRQLVVQDPDNGIELFYLRPLDIAVYVGRGAIDVGITGQDLLKNSGTAALEHMPLGFGTSTFRFAAPNESPITTLEDIQGKRVATTFDKLVHDYLVEHGIQAETIHLDGAVDRYHPAQRRPARVCRTAHALRSLPDSFAASERAGLTSGRADPPSARRAHCTSVCADGL